MNGTEQTSWWFDQGKWLLGLSVATLTAWQARIVWRERQSEGLAATVTLVGKHDTAIAELKESVGDIKGDIKGISKTLDKVEEQGQRTNDGMNRILGELQAHNGGRGSR